MEGFGTENHQPGQCIPSQEGWGRPHPSLFCFPAKRELLGFVLVTVFILCNQLQAQSVYSLFSPGSLTDYSDSLVVCFRFAAEHGFVTTPSTTLQPEPGGRICTGAPSHLWCWSFATAFIDAAWMREKFDTSVLEKRSSSSRIAFHNRPWETAWSFGTESGLSAISSIWTSSSLLQIAGWSRASDATSNLSFEFSRDGRCSWAWPCLRSFTAEGSKAETSSVTSAVSSEWIKRLDCDGQKLVMPCFAPVFDQFLLKLLAIFHFFWRITLQLAGFPYDVMAEGHYVPGFERGECSRYKSKELWPTVMRVSEEACLTYFDRVHRDFNKKVAVDYSAKLKAGEV